MVIENRIRKARKRHFCNTCNRTIEPGNKYHYLYGCACTGDPLYHIKICKECAAKSLYIRPAKQELSLQQHTEKEIKTAMENADVRKHLSLPTEGETA